MRHRRTFWGVVLVGMVCWFSGCASAPEQTPSQAATAPEAPLIRTPKTLAILPFENNSVTDPERYAPLSKGLSAMLITDLKKGGSALKLIERERIEALLKEIALGQTGSLDQATAIQAGKMLGAQSIAFGAFMVLGPQVRIDLRIVNVETSELILAESITGQSAQFIDLEGQLAGKIARSMNVAFRPPKVSSRGKIDAALLFSQGLEALDRGNRTEAQRLFTLCIEMDPAYRAQIDSVEGLEK